MSKSETPTNSSYLQERLTQLGVTDPSQYLMQNYVYGDKKRGEEGFLDQSFSIFTEDESGNIKIQYATLEGLKATYRKGDSKNVKDWFITRMHPATEAVENLTDIPGVSPSDSIDTPTEQIKKESAARKYRLLPGAGTLPFLPIGLINKYQDKTAIDTLFLTEGAFKAFKGDMHGIDIVGLTSINHATDRETLGLHEDIRTIIKTCNVKRVVWLVDGDCNNLSGDALANMRDLYKRPKQFFKSAVTLRQYLSEFENVEKWFVHPLSDQMDDLGNPKGLDDLLIAAKDELQMVIADLLHFSKKGNWKYFYKENYTWNESAIFKYFHLSTVDDFYLFHKEKYKDLAKLKEFIWNGTRYKWNEEKQFCEVKIPGAARDYFRVGDQYYEKFPIPNKYGEDELTWHPRMKSTIIEDHGKFFCQHIPKYKAFCNLPDHVSYSQVIRNCYNLYSPFEHVPEEGECEVTLDFLRHIFGTQDRSYIDDEGKEHTVNEFELGLDYIQLLYQRPTQILPILCLVSRQNNTGKTTFANWLRDVFQSNVAVVGNGDLKNDFNAHWAHKLIVICDEAKIDKVEVVEKVKSLSTAKKIFMNAKGKGQVEIEFFAKFIMISNYEDSFIYATDDDVRYWIRKVPVITKMNVELVKDLKFELRAFLDLLNKRKLKTDNLHRAWFHPDLIWTEALEALKEKSKSTLHRELRAMLRDMFMDFRVKELKFTLTQIREDLFGKRFERDYVQRVLKDDFKLKPSATVQRFSIPSFVENRDDSEFVDVSYRKVPGRPYTFPIERFLSAAEIAELKLDEGKQIAMELPEGGSKSEKAPVPNDDLPF